MTSKARRTRGFTLIETLVAIFILTVAIVGPLTIAAHALQDALMAKDRTTAIYLAQDGVEYVRYLRDNACLSNASGPCTGSIAFGAFTLCTADNGGCTAASIGYHGTTADYGININCDDNFTCPPLNYDTAHGWFTYDTVDNRTIFPSIFTRSFVVTFNPSNNNEMQVHVTVSWGDVGTTTHEIDAYETLYAWQ